MPEHSQGSSTGGTLGGASLRAARSCQSARVPSVMLASAGLFRERFRTAAGQSRGERRAGLAAAAPSSLSTEVQAGTAHGASPKALGGQVRHRSRVTPIIHKWLMDRQLRRRRWTAEPPLIPPCHALYRNAGLQRGRHGRAIRTATLQRILQASAGFSRHQTVRIFFGFGYCNRARSALLYKCSNVSSRAGQTAETDSVCGPMLRGREQPS